MIASPSCAECAIRTRAVCAYSSPEELAVLNAIKSYRLYPKGTQIVRAGDAVRQVGSIVSGVVKLTKTLSDGRLQLVGLQFQSDFIGGSRREAALYDAETCGEVLLCQFERARFEALMAAHPHLERRLLEMTMDELDAARDWLLLLGRKTAREKVASFLALFARRRAAAPGQPMALPLTRTEIADHLGLTLETVSRQMSKLKADGVITFKDSKTFAIADSAAFKAATGDG